MQSHGRGLLLVALGVLVLSFDALLIRLAATTPANVLFWRGAFAALAATLILGASRIDGREIRRHAPAAMASGALLASSGGLFVLAILYTRVANAVVILTAAPFCAALLSWLFLRERVAMRTWAAIVVVMVGVTIVFSGTLGTASAGDLAALGAAFGFGANMTVLRRHPDLPRALSVAVAGLLLALMALPWTELFQVAALSMAVLFVMGFVEWPLAMLLMSTGTRYLAAPEVSLFLVVESVLGPLWVWLALGEELTRETWIGGILIVGTLATHAFMTLRAQQLRSSIQISAGDDSLGDQHAPRRPQD